MFDGVARRYDLTNTVLSLGQDRFWRRATRSALRIGPGDKVLDLAAGTAVSTVELAASGAWCVAADFSVGMLAAGAQRPSAEGRGRRDAAAVRRRGVRRGDDQLRAAQRRRPRGGAAGDGAGDAAGRPAGGVRVLDADEPAVRDGLQGVPDAGAAADRPRGVVESGRLRLSGRVDPRMAGPGGAGAPDRRCGLVSGAVAQPHRRHRRAARGDESFDIRSAEPTVRSARLWATRVAANDTVAGGGHRER